MAALALWGMYWWGQAGAQAQLNSAVQTIAEAEQIQKTLREENATLKAGLTQAERQLQIDKSAYAEIRAMLESSNSEITELHNEIKFYRSIISPEDGKSGVRIQDFLLSGSGAEQVRYKLVLIQALQHGKEFSGVVNFEIKGSDNGVAKVIDMSKHGVDPVSVNFKYFQNLSGTLAVPAGFQPLEIKVSVSADKRRTPILEQWYPWPKA